MPLTLIVVEVDGPKRQRVGTSMRTFFQTIPQGKAASIRREEMVFCKSGDAGVGRAACQRDFKYMLCRYFK